MSGTFRNWKRWRAAGVTRHGGRVFAAGIALVAFALAFVPQATSAQPPRSSEALPNIGGVDASGSGSSAEILSPSGVAYDSAGNLFFVDMRRNQVFEVLLAGSMSVVAGTGEQGFGGDGGSAAAAQFNAPTALALAKDGALYIADTGNQRIRVIAGGEVRTIAGTGVRGSAHDGSAASSAALRDPGELAVDQDGSVLVCDTGNHRVLRIKDGVVRTIAGSGVQGFAGDGGPATAAELDTPSGVAVMGDGRIVIADAHNHRIRVVGMDGVIKTLAGTGARGYSGDGGLATDAKLFLPRGLSVTGSGDLLFADSNNHRMRSISASGTITTVAGDGFQGANADAEMAGKASLDTPRGVAIGPYGAGTFADAPKRSVREVAVDGRLYIVAAPAPSRVSTVALQVPQTSTYGDGDAGIVVTSNAAQPQGAVSLLDGNVTLGTATLALGSSSVPLQGLSAGVHTVSAFYGGDGLNPSAASASTTIAIAARQVFAMADSATMTYGSVVPQVTGVVTGILPQDKASVTASFISTAAALSPVGSYPILVTLNGPHSGNYKVALAPDSGSLKIVQAKSNVTLQGPAQTYAGLPLTLSASVGSMTSGLPTGEVDFLEDGAVIAKATAANGFATGTYLAPVAGAHLLTASYVGDANFIASISAPYAVTIAAMPDFTLSANTTGAAVQAGLIATYTLAVAPSGGPFTGSVDFSVSGLPSGAKASFSPAAVVPGAAGASVMLSIETPARHAEHREGGPRIWLALMPMLFTLRLWRRRHFRQSLTFAFIAAVLVAAIGCGARTVAPASTASQSFPLTVTAISTNLAGNVVTHSTPLTLTLQ